jgi:hypothetical protein
MPTICKAAVAYFAGSELKVDGVLIESPSAVLPGNNAADFFSTPTCHQITTRLYSLVWGCTRVQPRTQGG